MKRIITCNDGTWNQPGTIDSGAGVMTNVEKIYKCISAKDLNGNKQVRFYDNGVGTDPGKLNQVIGGVTGRGIDKNIKDTYKFIMWNYSGPDDEIYLFGFSRGAYTARSLAGFIRNCGILKTENLHLVDEAYELYRDRTILAHPDSDAMISFRNVYSQNANAITKIKCIGVWDTVGALGMPLHFFQLYNQERYKFHDVTLTSWVENAFHALAIDERRKLFSPALWQISKDFDITKNQMEQVWFAGVHANIGGGYKQTGLSDITLYWMIEKTAPLGLHFNNEQLKDDSEVPKLVPINPMMKGYKRDSIKDFWIYELETAAWRIMHFARDITDPSKLYLDKAGHRMAALKTHERIHISAWERFKSQFDKKISPYLEKTWKYFENNIDTTGVRKLDIETKETVDSGNALTVGKRKTVLQ